MMNMYIFTDKDVSKVLDMKVFQYSDGETPATLALRYRKKLGKNVVAWSLMGSENPTPDLLKR